VFQTVDFSSGNDLKFTYVHLQFQNFFWSYTPDPHNKGEGKEGGEGMGWDGMNPRKQILSTALDDTAHAKLKQPFFILMA
jgi:hypothetical protein